MVLRFIKNTNHKSSIIQKAKVQKTKFFAVEEEIVVAHGWCKKRMEKCGMEVEIVVAYVRPVFPAHSRIQILSFNITRFMAHFIQ